jgi:hypothetical protein
MKTTYIPNSKHWLYPMLLILARATKFNLLIISAALLGQAGNAPAQGVFDYGASAPTPGASDISQLTSQANSGPTGLNYYVDSGNPGQTFTTGSNPQGYVLSTLYLQEQSGSAGGGQPGLSAYTLRIYSLTSFSSGSAVLISTYVTTNKTTFTQGDWIKFTGLTNVLSPGSVYGYAIARNGSGWWRPANTALDPYTSGECASFPTASGNPTFSAGYNAAFDLSLLPKTDPLVTPTLISPANPIYAGTLVTLSASFSGTAPFTNFVWQTDGGSGGVTWTTLAGSTTNSYSLDTTSLVAGTYEYHLIVSGAAGTTTNTAASMTLDNASGPTIVANTTLTPSTIYTSGSTVMSATFDGTLPIYYQWQYSNGVTSYLIPGATLSSNTLSNVQFTNAGYYSLIASNNPGGIPTVNTSTPALLTVTPQVILSDLGGTTPIPGAYDIDQFSTNGNTGDPDANVDNYYDNSGPCGQTFTTGSWSGGYQLNAVNIEYGTVNGGHAAGNTYALRLYSISGGTATLLSTYVNQNTVPATALGDWMSWTGGITNVLAPNATYAYTFSSTGGGYEQLDCASGNPYADGTICTIPAAGGAVTLGASGNYDATFDLNLAQLGGAPTPPFVVINTTISPSSTVAGYPVTMTASIGGSAPLAYQWQFSDGATFTNNISGATNSSYTIYDVETNNTGYYQVVATNSAGFTNSGLASLTVSPLTDVEIVHYGASAPPVSGYDIAQLSTAGNQGAPAGLNYYDDNGNPPGQTFTTGSNIYGYELSELYIDMGSINGGHASGVTYTLSIYSISAGSATLVSAYVNNNTAPAIGTGTWTKWIGLTNILAPNTTYAYTISANGGYLQVANATNNLYAGGQLCVIPTGGGAVNYGSDPNEDGTFLVHLLAGPVVPDFGPTLISDTTLTPSGAFVGGSVTMGSSFSGIPLPTYQWMFNNGSGAVPIAGATSATYTISNAQLTNSGAYYLVASNNPNGIPTTAASTPVSLIVGLPGQTNNTLAEILDASSSPPQPGAYDISQLVVAIPSVVSNLNYYVDNVAPPGQTFTTGNTPPSPAGYPLNTIYINQELSTIGGGAGAAQTYTLGIYQMVGSNAVLLTSYSSANTLAVTDGDWIRWIGLTNILKTNTTYAFSIKSTIGSWKLGNDSLYGAADSQGDLYTNGHAALLPATGIGAVNYSTDPDVDAAFLIGLTPLGAPVVLNDTTISPSSCFIQQSVSMSAIFTGTTPIHYQWQFVDTNNVTHLIAGATNNTYTIASATLGNNGTYSLLASNALSGGTNVSSTPETLTVTLPPQSFVADFSYGSDYGGSGVLGIGTYWNTILNTGATSVDSTAAFADDGVTSLGIGFNATMTWDYFNTSPTALFSDYLLNQTGVPSTFGFSNLPNGIYNLVIYSCDGGYARSTTTFGIGNTFQTATTTTGASFVENNNYVEFTNIVVTNGTISGTWVDGSQEGALCGAQLQLTYSLDNNSIVILSEPPASVTATNGQPFSLSVSAVGPGTLYYQWYNNDAPVADATNSTYNIASAVSTNAGSYDVVITNQTSLAVTSSVSVVSFVSSVNTSPPKLTATVSGGVLSFSWPADHTGWRLLVQTNNLASGISTNPADWGTVPGSTEVDQTNLPIVPGNPTEFYRLTYP